MCGSTALDTKIAHATGLVTGADGLRLAFDGMEAGAQEVLADADTAAVEAQLSLPPEELYAVFTGA